ncbi:MAG: 3-hydroxyacyl-[acyl-carrier-protein] dehydratase FabZ [Ignavibacteria bacterium]
MKNVSLSEDVFTDHFMGYPVMPGALQIETVAQVATALLEVSSDFSFKAILSIVEKTKFRKLIRPGDQLIVKVNIITKEKRSAQLEGEIFVNDKTGNGRKICFQSYGCGSILSR